MNTSKIAANIIEDIYTFNEKYIKATNKLKEKEISPAKYATSLYILACKCTYLQEVVNVLKRKGYKFTRYEKERCVLDDLLEQISNNLQNSDLEELSMREQIALVTYLTKYEKLVNVIEDCFEELKENV